MKGKCQCVGLCGLRKQSPVIGRDTVCGGFGKRATRTCESAATPGPNPAAGDPPSPPPELEGFCRSIRNTGRCSASACFTVLTSSVLTQYFLVVRTKFCAPGPPSGPLPCAALFLYTRGRSFSKRSDICTTKTALETSNEKVSVLSLTV